jgi:hypothetical protein
MGAALEAARSETSERRAVKSILYDERRRCWVLKRERESGVWTSAKMRPAQEERWDAVDVDADPDQVEPA